jgi:hypothetical protein
VLQTAACGHQLDIANPILIASGAENRLLSRLSPFIIIGEFLLQMNNFAIET